MAITFHDVTFSPADNSANTTTPVSVTPPVGMAAGDLIIFVLVCATTTGASVGGIGVADNGGQTLSLGYNNVATNTNDIVNIRTYKGAFNGSWSSTPSFSFTGAAGTAKSVACYVFKKGTADDVLWAFDGTSTQGAFASPVGSTYSGGAKTTTVNDALLLFIGASNGANSFGSPSVGWTMAGSSQLRNTSGASIFLAYKLLASPGSSGTPTIDQTAGGPFKTVSGTTALKNYHLAGGLPIFFYQ